MNTSRLAVFAAAGLLLATSATASQYVYPTRGQDMGQQASDEAACSTSAARQTGFDPGRASAPLEAFAPTGSAADTAATGAVLGAIGTNGLQGGPAGALGGGAPGQAGSAVTAMSGAAADSLGVVDSLVGAEPEAGPAQPSISRLAKPAAQADFETARADCLRDRGYSVH
jgi:hypothetical protein